jgi:hypothetical protein|tara:strand:+ start:461 stop:574 length:114 start_codon:yes stop_codon:yes gene_type:complete
MGGIKKNKIPPLISKNLLKKTNPNPDHYGKGIGVSEP